MVADRPDADQTPAESVLEMAGTMEACAEDGDWDRVEEIVVRLRAAVMRVPEAERGACLRAARQSTEAVREKARCARGEVTDKLSEIRRGRDAAKAYGNPY